MNGFVRTKISLLAQILEGHSHLIIVSDLMIMMKLSAPVVAYNIYHYSWERPIHEGKLPLPSPCPSPLKNILITLKNIKESFQSIMPCPGKSPSNGKARLLEVRGQKASMDSNFSDALTE